MKTIVLSLAYFVLAAILLLLIDIGLHYLIEYVLFRAFDWFNRLNLWVKLIILFAGGYSFFIMIADLSTILASTIGGLIFVWLPENYFTVFSSLILSILNIIYNMIILWRVPEHYNFWIVIELLFVSGLIWQLTFIVIPLKYQVKNDL